MNYTEIFPEVIERDPRSYTCLTVRFFIFADNCARLIRRESYDIVVMSNQYEMHKIDVIVI